MREDLVTGAARDVAFFKVDISDADAVKAAFSAPWPSSPSSPSSHVKTTVFHTAANIRFYERHPSLLHRSAKVNVQGTQNVIACARSNGVDVLVYTSSGSVGVWRSRHWLWPWEKEPTRFFQRLDDETAPPTEHEDFFSNYAASKIHAEKLVQEADGTRLGDGDGMGIMKTGCLRPGNGVFGPGGDILCGAYLVRKRNPTWVGNIIQSFTYVENASSAYPPPRAAIISHDPSHRLPAAHLLYEQRLLELLDGNTTNPDTGGQAFVIADPNPPPTYGDVYLALETLSSGECYFPACSPTLMLLISHLIEVYYLTHHYLSTACPLHLAWLLPPALRGDVVNLQPSLTALVGVHLFFDDQRARRSPEEGGLGYGGGWTTLEGICKTAQEHRRNEGRDTADRSEAGGVSFDFGFGWGKGKGLRKREGKGVKGMLEVDPIMALN
jgi:hypothetical protein